MDKFGVPKKVNRHVLKALYYMSDHGYGKPDFTEICDLVEINMKNNVPVRDLPGAVRQSLHNMVELGVIEKKGLRFFVQNSHCSSTSSKDKEYKLFRANDYDNTPRSYSRKRHQESEDSMSGSDIEKSRKRFRSTKLVKRKGKAVDLPKARVSGNVLQISDHGGPIGFPLQQIYQEEEEWYDSDCSLPGKLSGTLISEITNNEMDSSQSEGSEPGLNRTNDKQMQTSPEEKENNGTPKTEPDSEEIVTAEQIVANQPEEDTNCSTDPKLEGSSTFFVT